MKLNPGLFPLASCFKESVAYELNLQSHSPPTLYVQREPNSSPGTVSGTEVQLLQSWCFFCEPLLRTRLCCWPPEVGEKWLTFYFPCRCFQKGRGTGIPRASLSTRNTDPCQDNDTQVTLCDLAGCKVVLYGFFPLNLSHSWILYPV